MNLPYPHFLINFKVYEGTAGTDGLELARTVERVAEETGAAFAVAPGTPDLRLLASATDLPVVAQAVDAVEPGRGTGRILPEAAADAGADAALVNHPEHRETLADVAGQVRRCREVGLDSVVCVDSETMGRAALSFEPDCLLFEKPEDVATGRAITSTHPERVESFLAMVDRENPRTRVLVGGGITTGDDVARAFDLGADAAGAASAFVGADDPDGWLADVVAAFP